MNAKNVVRNEKIQFFFATPATLKAAKEIMVQEERRRDLQRKAARLQWLTPVGVNLAHLI